MRILLIVIVLCVAASAATYARYESLHPCAWMEQDLAQQSSLPLIAVQARIRAAFLLDGITEPGALDCLTEWWHLRQEGLPPAE